MTVRSSLPPGLARFITVLRARLPLGPVLGLTAYVLGVIARWSYVLGGHHPRHFVVTDAMPIVALGEVLADPAGQQQFFHTIWPPGASAFFALSMLFDPTLGVAAWGQLLLSCLAPLLVAHAARLAYGPRAGWLALGMSALHFGFIHYGGFFLSEQLFQFAAALAIWASVAAVKATGRRAIVAGITCGAAWVLAFLFRPNALPVALLAGSWLAFWAWRTHRRDRLLALLAGTITLLVLLAPLAHRCSTLLGRFCPGSSNFAMNVALGHAPDTAGLTFRPQSGDRATGPNSWVPPARLHNGYTGMADVPASMYDTRRVLSWVKDQFLKSPGEFVLVTIGNAFDLFGAPYWPDDYALLSRRRATICKQLFFVFVIVPGMAFFGLQIVRRLQRRRSNGDIADVEALLMVLLVGVFLLAALSMGEARYRIPFDPVLILFAARAFTLVTERAQPGTAELPVAASTAAATVTGLFVLVLIAAAHPQVHLASRFARATPPSTKVGATLALDELGVARADGRPWDAAGNVLIACRISCPELRVDLGGLRHDSRVEVSTDHNDRYELFFYRQGRPVGRVAWGAFEGGGGMRTQRTDVPPAARTTGYDMLGIRPLYGDGRYSVGHVAFPPE